MTAAASSCRLPLQIVALALAACAAAEPPDEAHARLARQVRTLLSDRCFHCHGPDNASREADLRLDVRESLLRASMSDAARQVVAAGNADASELWHRISSEDAAVRMPPAESHLSLSGEEIALVKRWIEAGAPWTEHWSFVPPVAIEPPPPAFDGWGHNEIDRFVAARLKREGLEPSPPAGREQLLRRVTLDLTGLPPTIEEIDVFLSDEAPGAYERLVDRLLASPRFGERMATPWLDAARYADTYGYQADRYRPVWQWRDWVVQALNNNLPYDEFLVQQLAGDLLPNATREQKIATTFNRLHRQTNEGGSIPEEWRAEYVADRVNTLGAAVLGLTLECARCHDHKFDPVSQRDYYQLFAYFNNIDELGLYSHFTDSVPTPTLWLDTPEQRQALERAKAKLRQAEREYSELVEMQREVFETWYASQQGGQPEVVTPEPVGRVGFEADESPGYIGSRERTAGVVGEALVTDGENGIVTDHGVFDRHQPFTITLWVKPSERAERAVIFHRSRAWLDAAGRGYQLILEDGRPSAALVHFWPGNALAIRAKNPLPLGEWTHLAMTYDGSSRASGLRIYVNGQETQTEAICDQLDRTIRYVAGDLEGDNNVKLAVAHRFRDNGFRGGAVDEFTVFDRELSQPEITALPGFAHLDSPPEVSRDEWFRYYLAQQVELLKEARERLRAARQKRNAAIDAIPEIMVMRELPERRVTHLLERGAYDALGEAVEPTTPESIATDIPAGREDRLGLARWITDPRHPLTSRVAVNRFWHELFGRGLVSTLNDFGSQGATPSHPDLLDWLAVRFVDSGWDTKRLVKLMVTSATYRQTSIANPRLREEDPENVLLARGPSYRHSAEVLRDAALAASGLLVGEMGGPPVKPFQPPGLWEEKGAGTYARDAGPGSHRRSLYTIWKRTSPPPSMMVFDAADREVCVMQRQVTTTPLQSLVTLNDPQFVEAARGLADRAWLAELTSIDERVSLVFRAVTSREPTVEEQSILTQLYHDQHAMYSDAPGDAAELLAIGDHTPESKVEPEQLAALSMVALAVMNHDAFLMKR